MFKRRTPWLLVLIWMGLIFFLSSQQAADSNQLSTGITEFIIDRLSGIFPEISPQVQWLNHIVRKNAHFIAYLILGILLVNAFYLNGRSGWNAFILALLISSIYAISDELHQTFVPGRSGELRDVMIDTAGALTGIGMYMITWRRFKKEKT
ncbi:MAG: VanZ family protein [Gudongella sp.]|nr:VanZ family protein [Gudongella sp.]